jgi:hypothetical protein
MSKQDFEERFNAFWDECDCWFTDRLNEIATQGIVLSEDDIAAIEERIEEDINTSFEKGIEFHGESFSPHILVDLHHLSFELELKKRGVKNEEQIHRYKDNGLVGLSVVQGKIEPDNALLIMEVNRAHLEKKGSNEEEVCENCICGKKESPS